MKFLYAGDAIEDELDAIFLISHLYPFQNGGRLNF
jgi:hypothetical protein